MSDGKVLTAQPNDLEPKIGVKDSSGFYYFTITYGNGEPQCILDNEEIRSCHSRHIYIAFKSVEVGSLSSYHHGR